MEVLSAVVVFDMEVQVFQCVIPLTTDKAEVAFLPAVERPVLPQRRGSAELASAHRAQEGLPGVGGQVLLEADPVVEALPTLRTEVGFLLCVRQHVLSESPRAIEPHPAVLTHLTLVP